MPDVYTHVLRMGESIEAFFGKMQDRMPAFLLMNKGRRESNSLFMNCHAYVVISLLSNAENARLPFSFKKFNAFVLLLNFIAFQILPKAMKTRKLKCKSNVNGGKLKVSELGQIGAPNKAQ